MARPRKARREQGRELRKQIERVERAARELPGGAPEHPIEVGSGSVVDVKARGVTCLRCAGELEPRHDQATSTPRGVLRQIDLVCRLCHAPRSLWFRVVPGSLN